MKGFLAAITVVITSLYFFPFQFMHILPGFNTKLILACIGVFAILIDLSIKGKAIFDRNLFTLIVFAIIVSACGLASVIINNTHDYSYAGYVFSMLVWFSGAYVVVKFIKMTHGHADVRLIANYLLAVCVLQCIAAIMNDNIPAFKNFIDLHVSQGQDFINDLAGTKRKYGIGANLDTAGVRFSAVLCIIPAVIANMQENLKRKWLIIYVFAVLFLIVEGNIISRTTTVGVIFALAYVAFKFRSFSTGSQIYDARLLLTILTIIVVGVSWVVYMFNTNETFENDIRFGFEGFFSLFEDGEWTVSSNDRLQSMYVFPETLKTWLIGDGYFSNPINTDPYFIGKLTGGYYMGTDVGFLRFIFYFGLLGLIAFAMFFVKCGQICAKDYPSYRLMFYMLVLLNYVIWLKVATDIFLVFALFIACKMISTEMKVSKLDSAKCA